MKFWIGCSWLELGEAVRPLDDAHPGHFEVAPGHGHDRVTSTYLNEIEVEGAKRMREVGERLFSF
ncbi:MAG: hypothetical protein M3075_14955 [Candidatus Dormibacteraeota bacterium]|jgi:hypothetical protein|nr:hypothetical protein [Candidatus Dormibacteraeota bacterium]